MKVEESPFLRRNDSVKGDADGSRAKRRAVRRRPTMRVAAPWLTALLILAGCARSPYVRVPEDQIDADRKATAERVAYRLLTGWREGRYEPLSDDFTPEMQDALNPRAQRQVHADLRARMGELRSLDFVEAWASRQPPPLVLYRFRGTFSETSERPEVRVVLDERGRVAGFWCLKWSAVVR